MPPGGPKRKRSERNIVNEGPRASPHRPQDLDLARQSQPQSPVQSHSDRGRQTRRSSSRYSGQPPEDETSSAPATELSMVTSPTPTPAPAEPPAVNGSIKDTDKAASALASPRRQLPFEYLTEEIIQDWSSSGKESIKARLIEKCQDVDNTEFDVTVQELVEAAAAGQVDPQDAGSIIKDSIVVTASSDEDKSLNRTQETVLATVSILFSDETPFAEDMPNDYTANLAIFFAATEIDTETLRVELEAKVLEGLGLIRSTFNKTFIKKQTAALYKQSNYNLLREESEGFSKLLTELFTTAYHETPHRDVVNAEVEKVKAMIGAFNLDVGRSLDVVLDVIGSSVVRQSRFFVKFLRASPWWPRTEDAPQSRGRFSVGGLPNWALPDFDESEEADEQKSELALRMRERDTNFWEAARQQGLPVYFQLGNHRPATDGDVDANDDAKQDFIQATGTAPHVASSEAAQLLGFKLRFYAPGAEGDNGDGTPPNLIYLAALLIKIGFISLYDLYPHLWRPDVEMAQLKELKQKEKEDRDRVARPGASTSNALAKAGALPDDDKPAVPSRLKEQTTRASTPAKDIDAEKPTAGEQTAEQPDQKVMLLQSLLAIGALPEALFILGQFPWMMDLIPELPEYINRILHYSLSHVYNDLRPLSLRSSLCRQRPVYDVDAPGAPNAYAQFEQAPQRRTLRWPMLDKDDADADGVNYKFYWDEWNDNIPVCQNIEDVFTLCKTLLPLVGAKIGRDTSLILKFTRIGKASLQIDDSPANKDRWLDVLKRVLLPSLSLTKSNPGVVNEVFELVNTFSTETRYRMYLEWSKGDTSRTEDMRSAFGLAGAETRDVLKKISKTNVKPMARALAKIAYANPHIVITAALPQIESYDSIADVFIEGSRYFTDLGYDVLTWALVVSMEKDNRVGVQENGIFASRWLTALSHFIGKVYKRYNLMKPGPILQYVAKQLNKGKNIDLVVLEQLILAMAGIISDTNYNDEQLLAMGGGPLLQSQIILQLLDQRHSSRTTAKRLMKALHDCGLVSSLLLAMVQQRQTCIYQADDAPLKAAGHTFDEITRVLGQYLDLLRTNMSSEEFQKQIPSIPVMLKEWNVPAEIAFWIGRSVVQKQIAEAAERDHTSNGVGKEVNGDVDMKEEEDASEEDGEAVETDEVVAEAATPNEQEVMGNVDEGTPEGEVVTNQQWNVVLRDIMNDIESRLPSEVLDLVGVGFYVTFWQLSIYDINVPKDSYGNEVNRNKKKITNIVADRNNVSSSAAKARDNQVKTLEQLNEDLLAENKQHLQAFLKTKMRLTKEKDQWFAARGRVAKELNYALMEHCFLPRILLSPLDAYFCFKFLKMVHSLGTANFRTLGFYDNLFKAERLSSMFFMCTSKEADNLGKFLLEVLGDLAKWHASKTKYEQEAFGMRRQLPGFALRIENGKPKTLLEYEMLRNLLYKWHVALFDALSSCLASDEYMHVRNAISILRTVSPVYPATINHGRQLQQAVDKLRETDREDLKVASQALLGTLNRRQKTWVNPEFFRKGPDAAPARPTATPEPPQEETKPIVEADADTKMRDAPATKIERASTPSVKELEKTPSRDGRSPARSGTPQPSRPVRDSSLRPPRPESRTHELPRRSSPPPRFTPSSSLPPRADTDLRNGYRDSRPPRSTPGEQSRTDTRSGYPPRHIGDRGYEAPHEPSSRYPPRSADRPSMLDRDERPSRRDHEVRLDARAAPEDRRYNEREPRPDRDVRSERDTRPERDPRHDRDFTRTSEREHNRPSDRDHHRPSERSERDFERSGPTDRRRDDSSRRDVTSSSRTTTPAIAPIAPGINPERAALIQANDDRPSMSIRGQAQDRARTSRPSSPRREDDRKHAPRNDRDERYDQRTEPARTAPMQAPPARNLPPSGPPTRDTRAHGRPQVDMSHGRLEQDNIQRPQSRSDRPIDAEPPAGPRSRSSNVPPRNDNVPAVRPPARQPPSGPGRHSRTNSYAEPAMSPASTDISGIHPDRLNNLPSQAEPPRNTRPPPLQTSPPSAPRGAPTGPASATIPSPSSRGPPSGPQADSAAGRGQRNPMAAVNNHLTQAARGGGHGRGRGGMRQNSLSYNNGGMPPSPVGPPSQNYNNQPDLINNPNGMPVQPRGPLRPDMRNDEGRSTRSHQNDGRDAPSGYKQDMNDRSHRGPLQDGPPRNGPRGYSRGPNPNGPGDGDGAHNTRKHPRDEPNNAPYSGRGGRMASESKRGRRGG